VYRKIFHYKPRTSVNELIHCLERMNFEYLFYQKELCFLHNLMFCNNRIVASVMGIFTDTDEYATVYNFTNVTPFDNKTKISHCLQVKFVKSIVAC